MAELKIENKLTFENQEFKQIPIPAKKQDGFNPTIKLFIEQEGNTLLVVKNESEVVLKIIGDSLTVIPVQ